MTSRNSERAGLVLGGEPRADLLPPELRQAAKGKVIRRIMSLTVVLSVVLVGAGYALATMAAMQSQVLLDNANQRTTELLNEQRKYVDVRLVTATLTLAETAREIGMSSEIDWAEYLSKVQAVLPAGVAITTFIVDAATPMTAFGAPDTPLQGDRIASITFTASAGELPDIRDWLNALKELNGYADAWSDAITLGDGGYVAGITMHVNRDALANRFTGGTSVEGEG